MAEITAALVKELREKTGSGMMDCKKALVENDGNLEASVDWLRKKGLASASKKAGRIAAEGAVGAKVKDQLGVLIEVNAETDFVAKNEKFVVLAENLLNLAYDTNVDVQEFLNLTYPNTDHTVQDEISNNIAVIGENITVRRIKRISAKTVVSYIHNAVSTNLGKIAVLVALDTSADVPVDELNKIGRQLAMHAAASRPIALVRENVDNALLEREKNILREKAQASGKPDSIIEKMVEGGVNKYYEDIVFLEQVFVIDGKNKVKEFLANESKRLSAEITIADYAIYQLGEGIEKEVNNFQEEVAKMAGQNNA